MKVKFKKWSPLGLATIKTEKAGGGSKFPVAKVYEDGMEARHIAIIPASSTKEARNKAREWCAKWNH